MMPLARNPALFSQPGIQGCSAFRYFLIAAMIGIWFPTCPVVIAQEQENRKKVQATLETRAQGVCFVVKSLSNPSSAKVRVWRSDSDTDTSPPMMGAASVDQGDLVFTPRFPIQRDADYVVRVQQNPNAKPTSFRINVPGIPVMKTEVVDFYPSANELPENTLKFYVQFSAPMQKGDIYRFIQLQEVGGQKVELPFLEIEQEFWSRDSERLTLLLDPGRIKRGLRPREEMGPILVAGKSYLLVIDGSWKDSNGKELGRKFVKRFLAVEEDHSQPNPEKWNIQAPIAGSRDPLAILFSDSLDHAMLFLAFDVIDPDSNPVTGSVTVSDQEKSWSFVPNRSWESGVYKINVNKNLEDNAGNSIGRPFDVDLFEKTESSDSTPFVELMFEVSK